MKSSVYREKCLCCNAEVVKVMYFGMHPFADTFIPEGKLHMSEPCFPLEVSLCETCGTVQTNYETPADERYNLYDYSYTSSNSEYSRNYWESYKVFLKENFDLYGKKILEIGCNDGFLLSLLRDLGADVVGVDASKTMIDICNQKDIRSHQLIFGSEALPISFANETFDIIIANNVVNHSNSPLSFFKEVSNLLKDQGIFIFEQPYWGDTVDSLRLDQVYHEHVTYFTLTSALAISKKANLKVFNASKTSYHGGSLRTICSKDSQKSVNDDIKELLEAEVRKGYFSQEFYKSLTRDLAVSKYKFLEKFFSIKKENPNATFVGIGAAAKANTYINFLGLNSTALDYVSDISEYKIGKYTPLSRIKIIDDKELKNFEDLYIIILSWNLPSKVLDGLKAINPKLKVINT